MNVARVIWLCVGCLAACFLAGCGGGGSKTTSTPPNTIVTTGANVVPIQVNSGPDSAAFTYVNGAFVSVTVCVPGTSTCQTIPEVLVDTGSVGLRIVSENVLTVALAQQKTSGGDAVAECLQFLDSYTWGPVQTADVTIGGETAKSVPVQVLSDSDYQVPTSCGSMTPGSSADTVATLGANGILGVGLYAQDCGSTCPASANTYFSCPSATTACTAIAQSSADQVTNPVTLFAKDNNGVILELPAVSGAEATVSGSMVFGIGTESNNALGSATVYTVDASSGNFNSSFNGTTFTDAAFIDSGSNGYFFPDSSITQCASSSSAYGFYCPNSTVNLSATTSGVTAGSGTVNFSVGNAENLFSDDTTAAGFGDLGGPTTLPTGSGSTTQDYFDWGLPFFYGRNVFVAIDGQTAPGGATPYWAY